MDPEQVEAAVAYYDDLAVLGTGGGRLVGPALVVGVAVPFAAAVLVERYRGRPGALAAGLLAGRALFLRIPERTQTRVSVGVLGIAVGMVALGVGRATRRALAG